MEHDIFEMLKTKENIPFINLRIIKLFPKRKISNQIKIVHRFYSKISQADFHI